MPWTCGALRVFHGTDHASAQQIAPGGVGTSPTVNIGLCAKLTDFGLGFYTTSYLHQAKQWANQRVRRIGHGTATVLAFDLDRTALGALPNLVFVTDSSDFYDLIAYSRRGGTPHSATGASFDVVYGPVSLWPQYLAIKDCDQISFHTPKGLTVLRTVVDMEQGQPLF